jgi:Protein of unknown function (DUF3485)
MPKQSNPAATRKLYAGLVAVVVGITIATGIVHGRLTQRWGPVPDLIAAAKHLDSFPKEFGDWQFVANEPMDAGTINMLSCAGYVNRQYVNRKSGQKVFIAILLGPAGPIAVHTPEVCYSSRDYEISQARRPVTLQDAHGKSHSFWTTSFNPNTPTADQLHVYYAWNGSGVWEASTSPRFEFAGKRMLYKLQLASLLPTAAQNQTNDPCQDFLSSLLRSGWIVDGKIGEEKLAR